MPVHQTKTPSGTLAHIRIDGVLHRKHFRTGTDPLLIKQWLLSVEMRHRGQKHRRTGRFDEDARVYLDAVKAMPTYKDRESHVLEWIEAFGSMYRHSITSDMIAAHLAMWRTAPRDVNMVRRGLAEPKTRRLTLSASAVNKRRTALMHLYTVLDGKSAPNPVKDVPKFREPAPLPRGLPYSAIEAIWKAMGDTKTRARLQVIAYTGLPHAQVAQLKAEHWDKKASTLIVHGRKKGAGTKARVIPLTAPAVKALRAMDRTDAWGSFSRSTMHREFRAACAQVPALKGLKVTPYDLRHSFGTEIYRATGDIRATQALLDHSSPTLTHRYMVAALEPRVVAAVKAFGTAVELSPQKRRQIPANVGILKGRKQRK